jgi:hypothetical protein
MINLPQIRIKRAGMKLSVELSIKGDLFPSRDEWLELNAHKYLSKHPQLSRKDIITYLLWLIRDKDFVVFEFGDNPWNYIQFIKTGENLDFDFPYSIKLGTRTHMVDRVELILKRYGFTRFVTPLTLKTLHYSDSSFNSMVALDASFGIRRNDLAADVTLAIAAEIFRQPLDGQWKVILGTQRGMDG